ncbi:serine hydrolase FSH [Pyrenochaeta sp. MPI-SDFR-AT-0127]|nr:serine hydrolase FSH [Pyrenochaeta sp. MPI-SDFR-AT-0127]
MSVNDKTLHLPRILCLHGGGTNARIFKAQCRRLTAQLDSEFRFVFAEAAFASDAGSDVLSVYSQWGPFKRWLRWLPEHPWTPPDTIVTKLDYQLAEAMQHDNKCGGTGKWVALLGFSQGAKVAASLLYRQQVREEVMGKHNAGSSFQFGILMAGRSPLISLDPGSNLTPALPNAAEITDSPELNKREYDGGHILRIPTLHVHGLRDMGLHLHQQLFEDFCDPACRRLVVWDGAHRLPLKLNEVSPVVHQIRELAKQSGIY